MSLWYFLPVFYAVCNALMALHTHFYCVIKLTTYYEHWCPVVSPEKSVELGVCTSSVRGWKKLIDYLFQKPNNLPPVPMKLFVNCCLLTCFEWILTVIWANKFVLVSTGFARTCTTLGLVTVDTYRQWRFLSGEKYRFLSDWENKNNKFVVHKLQTKKSAVPLVWIVWGKAACTSLS